MLSVYTYKERTGKDLPILPDIAAEAQFEPIRTLPPRFRSGALAAHAPKVENPLYRTSNASYGARAPADPENMTKFFGRSNKFSTHFNGFTHRDYGLNTSLTKNKIVHHNGFEKV